MGVIGRALTYISLCLIVCPYHDTNIALKLRLQDKQLVSVQYIYYSPFHQIGNHCNAYFNLLS